MWEKILKALRAKGLKGDKPGLEEVKKFAADIGFDFYDSDGNPVDLDAEHKKATAKKSVVLVDDDTDDLDGDKKADKGDTGDVAEFREWQRKQRGEVRGTKADRVDPEGGKAPAIVSAKTKLIDFSRKRYEASIALKNAGVFQPKSPVWGSVEEAEAFAAPIRLWLCKSKGDFDYEFKDHDRNIAGKTWQTNVNTGAGYLVQPELVSTVMWLTEQYGVATKIANVVSMSSDERRQPRQTGIPAMAALAEGGTYAESDASLDMITLRAKKAGRIYPYTWELFSDSSVAVADLIARNAAEAAAMRIDLDYIAGDSTSEYNGISGLKNALPSSAYISASGGSWSAITASDFWKLSGSVENVNPQRQAFLCSRQFFHQVILKLAQATAKGQQKEGGNDSIMAAWTPATQNGGGPGGMLNGYPVFFDQSGGCPTATAGTLKSCYFGDFMGASMIGLRRQLELETSTEAGWTTDTIKVKARMRYDVNIHGDGRGSTYGPIVSLVTT